MDPTVPFTDLGAMADEIWPGISEPFRRAISSAEFIGGPAVELFEDDWARFCGVSHAIGVANGTDALQLTLRALGVGPGDEVVVPASTFVATAEAVVLAGATPRFADVDPQTMLITPDSLLAAITPRTQGAIAVHLYGQPADMEELSSTASERGLFLLEDAAQAHGASWRGQLVGSFGDAACFSFYPSKNLGAFGDGGAVVTRDANLARRIRSLADHGRMTGSHHGHSLVGTTSRLDSLQARVLHAKLGRLPVWTEARRAAAARYREGLADLPGLELMGEHVLAHHVYHLFVVRLSERDRVRAELGKAGVQTGVHYALPCHKEMAFAQYALEELPNSEAAATEVLSLPMFPHISRAQVDRVIDLTRSLLTEKAVAGAPAH